MENKIITIKRYMQQIVSDCKALTQLVKQANHGPLCDSAMLTVRDYLTDIKTQGSEAVEPLSLILKEHGINGSFDVRTFLGRFIDLDPKFIMHILNTDNQQNKNKAAQNFVNKLRNDAQTVIKMVS